MKRGCGILLHVSSLPDGTFKTALPFIDFLAQSGVRYWQILAAGPTGCGSPYSPLSVFAGNPEFIDKTVSVTEEELGKFKADNKFWLESYIAFMSKRDPKTDHIVTQAQYFKQWSEIKQYANDRGIQIIGDIPIYTAIDSADVFAWPEQFDLSGVAGVPPDYFNKDGQHWGNPLYDFKQMARDKYKWWIARMAHMAKMYDVVRIDHFRAFDTYWKIPAGTKDAKKGAWCKGPGMKIFDAIRTAVPGMQIILEDLGEISKSVLELRDETGYPGMGVMQFGFDGDAKNAHLPDNYPKNCTGYIGTHDNDTFVGFLKSADKKTRVIIDDYLSSHMLNEKDTTRLAIENILSSRADIVVLTTQDLLFQDSKFRMNTPGTVGGGNWKYRIKQSDLSDELAGYLRMLIERYGR